MAAAYDGDGNRVFQLNYNPEKESTYRCGTTHDDTRNRCGILFPVDDRSDRDHRGLIYDIHNTRKHGDYELIEYINDVNREYTEVLVENSFGGRTDTSYIYGVDRLSFDYENGCSGYYLYDPRGSVTGITNEQGRLVQSYRYDAFGNLTFGEPRYENEYTYNGESYNPNIESQYLRARYYDVVNANFLTEDSYLGNINEPLTLNRYNYCILNPLMYTDPSGMITQNDIAKAVINNPSISARDKVREIELAIREQEIKEQRKDNSINYLDLLSGVDKVLFPVGNGENYLDSQGQETQLKDSIEDSIEEAETMKDICQCEFLSYLSDNYLSWLTIAEGMNLFPYIDEKDNSNAKANQNVTLGIGFTFDNKMTNWDVLNDVLGWSNDEIEEIIDSLYAGKNMSDSKYVITEEQAYELFEVISGKYIDDLNNALAVYNTQSEDKVMYTQAQLEAMFDYSYNNGLSNPEDINNTEKMIYYYVRKDLAGGVEAMKRLGSGKRRRLNQVNLFFYETYEFIDSGKDEDLEVLRDKFGF